MRPKLLRRGSSDALAQMQAVLGGPLQAQAIPAARAQAPAETFVASWTEEGCLVRGSRLIQKVTTMQATDSALKRAILHATVGALRAQSQRFADAWTTLTRADGPYGLPPSITAAYLAQQSDLQQVCIHADRVQQWERDLRLQLATSGVLARLVLTRAQDLSCAQLSMLAAQPTGLERRVGQAVSWVEAHHSAQKASTASWPHLHRPLSLDETARLVALQALDKAQQESASVGHSTQMRAFLATRQTLSPSLDAQRVRALLAAFAGIDVAASLAFYESPSGRAWRVKQNKVSDAALTQLWDILDAHFERIDRWLQTMA